MTPAERAATLRFLAAYAELKAAEMRTMVSVVEAAESMRKFGQAWQAGMDADLAGHPDMAELNVRMDALYGD